MVGLASNDWSGLPISLRKLGTGVGQGDNHQIKCCYCCLGIAQNAQLLKKRAWPLHLIGVNAPHAALYNDVGRIFHVGRSHGGCAVRTTEAQYHADVLYLIL